MGRGSRTTTLEVATRESRRSPEFTKALQDLKERLPEFFETALSRESAEQELLTAFPPEFFREETVETTPIFKHIAGLHDYFGRAPDDYALGSYRECYIYGDTVVKVPDTGHPVFDSIGSQFCEAAAIDIGFRDNLFHFKIAESEIFYSSQGIPIIVMECLEFNGQDFDYEFPTDYEPADLRYDQELHRQFAYSNISHKPVFFDVGHVPKDPDPETRFKEFFRSSHYWPINVLQVIEKSRHKAESIA